MHTIYDYLLGKVDLSYLSTRRKLDGVNSYKHLSLLKTKENRVRVKPAGKIINTPGISPEKEREVSRLYAEGLCNIQISRITGISEYRVKGFLRKIGKTANKSKHCKETEIIIVTLNGETINKKFKGSKECADFLGCSVTSVRSCAGGFMKSIKGATLKYVD